MKKYRKKPIVIEAIQFIGTSESFDEIKKWSKGNLYYDYQHNPDNVYIETLEGHLYVTINDFIIKGIAGEFYPCKPDIFEKTYEEVL